MLKDIVANLHSFLDNNFTISGSSIQEGGTAEVPAFKIKRENYQDTIIVKQAGFYFIAATVNSSNDDTGYGELQKNGSILTSVFNEARTSGTLIYFLELKVNDILKIIRDSGYYSVGKIQNTMIIKVY